MKKLAICGLLVGGALLLQAGVADAAFLGTFCWQKTPFLDIIKADVVQDGASFLLHGTQATSLYVIPFTGTIGVGSAITVGLVFANNPAFFGGSFALKAFGTINPSTLAMSITTVGDAFAPSAVTATPVACPAGPFGPITAGMSGGLEEGQ